MNTLQGQQHALNREISRLTAENPQFIQAVSPGLAEIATAVGQAVRTAISNANPRSNERQSLVDIKGLVKPPTFNGESSKCIEWLRKTTGFLIAAHGSGFRSVIEWVEDQDSVIMNEARDRQFGAVKTTPQMTRFRDVKVCKNIITDEIDDHRIQSDCKCTVGLQYPEGKNSTLGIAYEW